MDPLTKEGEDVSSINYKKTCTKGVKRYSTDLKIFSRLRFSKLPSWFPLCMYTSTDVQNFGGFVLSFSRWPLWTTTNLNLPLWSAACSRISTFNLKILPSKLLGDGDPPSLSLRTAVDGSVWLPILKSAPKRSRLSTASRFLSLLLSLTLSVIEKQAHIQTFILMHFQNWIRKKIYQLEEILYLLKFVQQQKLIYHNNIKVPQDCRQWTNKISFKKNKKWRGLNYTVWLAKIGHRMFTYNEFVLLWIFFLKIILIILICSILWKGK